MGRREKRYVNHFILGIDADDIRQDLKICDQSDVGTFKNHCFPGVPSARIDIPGTAGTYAARIADFGYCRCHFAGCSS